ncbi:TonB-linked SusC/RagA family outer membrane protein [Filimonas zeae]|nr:TonB-dependent receptor [Filimonas zeae]MDR6337538.1 TonB-linked SusC/RagA family outer membrane protein [Filimonas zeae]
MLKRIIPKLICLLTYLLFTFTVWAQDKTITGVVSDEKGTPLSGATVAVKEGKRSVLTNDAGTFTLKLPAGAKTLVITYVGLEAKEVEVGTSVVINVTLKGVAGNLNDVVVIGYGSAKRTSVTTSISSISEKDIKNLPVAGVDQALQGKVAGVTVSNNGGQPGGGVSVRIRGITSVNGTEPLYVVDGVPILTNTTSTPQDQLGGKAGQSQQSIMATLNPNDIASIDILKDASAQAIYGSLGANGVILITTKKGKSGEGKISYDVYHGWQAVPKKLDVLNLRQFAQYYNSLIPEVAAASPGSMLPEIEELKNPAVLGEGTNWQKALFQQGHIDNHQLSFSGGQNKTTYYFSLNYFDQTGTIIGSDFKRYSSRFAIDHQVKPWLKAGITGNLSRSNQRITLTDGTETPTTIVLFNSPATPIRDAFGQFMTTSSLGNSSFGYSNGNPIATALLRDVRSVQNKAFGNIYAEINFTPYLSLRNEVNYDFQLTQNSAFQPKITNENTNQTILAPSRLREDKNSSYYWALRNYLTFNKSFGKHYVNAVVGHEAQASYYDNAWVTATNLNLNIKSINAGTIDPAGTNGNKGEWAMESYFARASYSYTDRYSISGSVRRDGSSSFGPNNRIGYFSAGSVAWTISNEAFAKQWDFVSYLKLRAGIGAVGNQNSPVQNAYSTNIRLFAISPFGAGGIPANAGNPNLSWESVVTQNLGVDASFINKRIELSVDVYNKKTTDMVLSTILPVFAGLDPNPPNTAYKEIEPPVTNAGEMTNRGIDISLTTYNFQQKDFSWRTNIIFSKYKNKLVKLNSERALLRGAEQDYTGSASVVNVTQAGGAVGTFYGYVTDGLFRNMNDLNTGTDWGLAVGPTGVYLGDIRYKDISGPKGVPDGKIGSEDVMVIGDPNPKFTYGITNTFQYKDFDFSFFLQGVQGSQIFNWTRKYTESMADAYVNQLSTVLNRYSAANPNSDMPRFNMWNNNNTRNSDRYIEDGSYLRIQNISLGYNLPKKWLNAAKVNTARLYISAQNIHTFTKYSGYDPEIGSFNKNVLTQNVDNGHYPTPKTFTIGANIQF